MTPLRQERKNKKKAKEFAGENEDFNDYTTTKKLDINKLFGSKKIQSGGVLNEEYNLSGGFQNYNILNRFNKFRGGFDSDHIDDVEEEEEVYHDKDLEVEDEIIRKDDEEELEQDKIEANELSDDDSSRSKIGRAHV